MAVTCKHRLPPATCQLLVDIQDREVVSSTLREWKILSLIAYFCEVVFYANLSLHLIVSASRLTVSPLMLTSQTGDLSNLDWQTLQNFIRPANWQKQDYVNVYIDSLPGFNLTIIPDTASISLSAGDSQGDQRSCSVWPCHNIDCLHAIFSFNIWSTLRYCWCRASPGLQY